MSQPDHRDVTVVIPSTNRVALLRTALDGVRRQTVRTRIKEVLVSENTVHRDDVAALCAEFSADLPIRFLHRDPPVSGLKHGLLILSEPYDSTYTAILHDDDWWAPEHLAHSLEALDTTAAVASYTGFFDITGESAPLRADSNVLFWFGSSFARVTETWLLDSAAVVASCVGGTPGRYSTLVARTTALNRASEVLTLGNVFDNDRMLSVAFCRDGKVAFCPSPSAYIRIHPGQDSLRYKTPEVIATMTKTTQWLLAQAPLLGVDVLAAVQERLKSCPEAHRYLVNEVLSRPWARQPLRQLPNVPAALRQAWADTDRRALAGNPIYLQKTAAWRAKVSKAVAMLDAKQTAAGTRELMEVIKMVQGCDLPAVTLEALIETSSHLGKVDRPRAAYLLEMAAKLAQALDRSEDQDRAEDLAASFSARPSPGQTAA
jgi:hypothetical protein